MENQFQLPGRIFFADDDEDDRDLLEDVLEVLYPKVIVKGFKDGLELLNELMVPIDELPKIIFLDLNMPRLNGIEFLTEIRKSEMLKSISIVILTTSSSPIDLMRCQNLGVHKFLTKPNSYQKWLELIKSTVSELFKAKS
tara:strand:+ start:3941 stop:4360 length:420 start_codon:yes stop_codon:yes gene_type:complete